MGLMLFISDLIIPIIFVVIIAHGFLNKVSLFDEFVSGAKDGFQTIITIMPTLIGLMVSVGVLRASGALEIIANLVSPLTDLVGFPKEALPLSLMRLVSSSASTGLLLDIFKNYGPDSFLGRFVSIMMSCTETIFYTMSIYFVSVKVTKTRYTLKAALFANIVGIISSIFITQYVFGH